METLDSHFIHITLDQFVETINSLRYPKIFNRSSVNFSLPEGQPLPPPVRPPGVRLRRRQRLRGRQRREGRELRQVRMRQRPSEVRERQTVRQRGGRVRRRQGLRQRVR